MKLGVLYQGTAANNTHKGIFHFLFPSYQSDLIRSEIISVFVHMFYSPERLNKAEACVTAKEGMSRYCYLKLYFWTDIMRAFTNLVNVGMGFDIILL